MSDDVVTKFEALRMAALIMTQSATAGKGDDKPSAGDVLEEAKKIHKWIIEKA